METKLSPTSDGKFVKPCDKLANPEESTSSLAQSPQASASAPLDEQEEEPDKSYSLHWCYGDKHYEERGKGRTVEDWLKRNSVFRKIAEKNKNKELVIERQGKAISSHFPCSLTENDLLTVKFIKAVDHTNQLVSGSVQPQRKRPSGELLMFHLWTKGGKNVVYMLRNPALKTDFCEMTVYAYRGEQVREALKRDGRITDSVLEQNWALSDTVTKANTGMSSFVDDLDGKTFQIILLDKSNPPESQDSAYMPQNEAKQSIKTESVTDNIPNQNPNLNDDMAPENIWRKIPDSKTMQSHLSSQFQDAVKRKKTPQGSKLSRIHNLLRVEFGKNVQTCREVKTMKTLMNLSDSVCQVRINDSAAGSGFLLFGKFVLTNAHVVSDVVSDKNTLQLNQRVTVHFSFESLNPTGSGVAVEEVVAIEYGLYLSGYMCDWALLRVRADQALPAGLLNRLGILPHNGGICIIGHPDGGVKKIDPCLIIPTENRPQVVKRHRSENPEGVLPENPHYYENNWTIQMITQRFFDNVTKHVQHNRQALTYESCFYFGSSGSPVFDEHCNVVAMHTGGYAYGNARGQRQSIIEYAHPLSFIKERIFVRLKERKRNDVLEEYEAYAQN